MWRVEQSGDGPGGRDRGQTLRPLWDCRDLEPYPKNNKDLVEVLSYRSMPFHKDVFDCSDGSDLRTKPGQMGMWMRGI